MASTGFLGLSRLTPKNVQFYQCLQTTWAQCSWVCSIWGRGKLACMARSSSVCNVD